MKEKRKRIEVMIRKIIEINEEKCNGCGICATACHEGAIGMVDGKAKLLKDSYCDGLGDCLPVCPTDAISFVEREADAYDEEAVEENMKKRKQENPQAEAEPAFVCPGTRAQTVNPTQQEKKDPIPFPSPSVKKTEATQPAEVPSQLQQWPVQIKLAPTKAPYFDQAHLLIAADCSAYAYGNFHNDFMKKKVTIIGCPKLDNVEYGEKLTEIIRDNEIKSVTLVRMEVPCCGGLEVATKEALQKSGKFIPWQVVTLSLQGEVLD